MSPVTSDDTHPSVIQERRLNVMLPCNRATSILTILAAIALSVLALVVPRATTQTDRRSALPILHVEAEGANRQQVCIVCLTGCNSEWEVIVSPNVGNYGNIPRSVAMFSPNDI